MPIYEYQCQKCHQVDEYLMKFSDPDPTDCLKCDGPVAKLVSQTSFALKGEGWYVTDYKAQSKKDEKSETKAEEPKPAGETVTPVASTSGSETKAEPAGAKKADAPAVAPSAPSPSST